MNQNPTAISNAEQQIQRLSEIGIALSAERDINTLLEMIIDEAMAFTNADAGTLYVVDHEKNELHFEIVKNTSLGIHQGGTSSATVTMPSVPLEKDGLPNFINISAQAALTGEVINIADVYNVIGYDMSGARAYDQRSGYRTKSMLVVPMRNHDNDIIGILQLLNAQNEQNEIVTFPLSRENMVISLASQAAVSLENAKLIEQLKNLLYSFIESIATAIDEKSSYTSGHIRRVTDITMLIAQKINDANDGQFEDVFFTETELEELRIAALLHDVGKIVTPEYIVDKSSKLQTVFDRIEAIKVRFELIEALENTRFLNTKVSMLENQDTTALAYLEKAHLITIAELHADASFIIECNASKAYLNDLDFDKLQKIATKTYLHNGEEKRYLTDDEFSNLSIRRGNLNEVERIIIENHALVTIKMLRQLPFPPKLSHVPEYAGGHHEKLDGSGYPFGLKAKQLPLQARIMAIADIFEALTAKDRPYKKPMKLSQALSILSDMCNRNQLDANIFHLFLKTNAHLEYAFKTLNKNQIDVYIPENFKP